MGSVMNTPMSPGMSPRAPSMQNQSGIFGPGMSPKGPVSPRDFGAGIPMGPDGLAAGVTPRGPGGIAPGMTPRM
jgi:hypothetical protein